MLAVECARFARRSCPLRQRMQVLATRSIILNVYQVVNLCSKLHPNPIIVNIQKLIYNFSQKRKQDVKITRRFRHLSGIQRKSLFNQYTYIIRTRHGLGLLNLAPVTQIHMSVSVNFLWYSADSKQGSEQQVATVQ